MSLDFLHIRKDLRKDTLNFKYLTRCNEDFLKGEMIYAISHKSPLTAIHNPNMNTLRIRGSFPYFINGHNFRTTNKDVIDAIFLLSDMLNIDLVDSEVRAFENGEILETELSIREILANHIRIEGMETKTYKHGKIFKNTMLITKLYNEKINMQKISLQIRKGATRDFGYDPTKNYIKIENHYKEPEAYFRERGIKLRTLLEEDFENDLKNDLLTAYQNIQKTGTVKISTDKRELSTSTVFLLALKEMEMVCGFDANAVINNVLKSIPSSFK